MNRAIAILILCAAISAAQNPAAPLGQPSGAQAPDKPSNGVFRLSAHQVPRHHLFERDIPPPLADGSPAWEGLIGIDTTNIDTGPVTLNNHEMAWSYVFEVFDSAGRPAPRIDPNTRNYAGTLLAADELELTYTLHIPGRSAEGKD